MFCCKAGPFWVSPAPIPESQVPSELQGGWGVVLLVPSGQGRASVLHPIILFFLFNGFSAWIQYLATQLCGQMS